MTPLDFEACELQEDFARFVRAAWPSVEPSPLEWGWYLDVICSHVQATVAPVVLNSDDLERLAIAYPGSPSQYGFAVENGRLLIRRLVLNVPPRMAKSLLIGVLFPAWVWTRRADCRILTTSYASTLSDRDAGLTRSLVESPWYRERWPHLSLAGDEAAKSRYSIESGLILDGSTVLAKEAKAIPGARIIRGRRFATSVGSRVLGEGGEVRIVDDPNDTKQREGTKERENARRHVFEVLPTRTTGRPEEAVTIIFQQRTHEEDCTGTALEAGGWQHVCLPMEWDGQVRSTCLGEYDPRRVVGELLDPGRYPQRVVDQFKKDLGPYVYSSQMQQTPKPATGGYFERQYVTFWLPAGAEALPVRDKAGVEYRVVDLPEVMDELIQSWDASQKGAVQAVREGRPPDKSAGHVWARRGLDCYLMDRDSRVMDVVALAQAIRSMRDKWPQAGTKLIEGKANGPAVMAMLRDDVAGMVEINPTTSKESRVVQPVVEVRSEGDRDARAISMQGLWVSGNIILPHPTIAPWVWDLIEQFVGFPLFGEDDDVDAASQAIGWLGRNAAHYFARMQREAKDEDVLRRKSNPEQALQDYIHQRMRLAKNKSGKADSRPRLW